MITGCEFCLTQLLKHTNTTKHLLLKKKEKKKGGGSIWIPYPGSHTLATQPGTSFPLRVVEEHNYSPLHITMSACQWGANDRAALWEGCTVGEPRDTTEWAAGGCPGGRSATPTKSHWGSVDEVQDWHRFSFPSMRWREEAATWYRLNGQIILGELEGGGNYNHPLFSRWPLCLLLHKHYIYILSSVNHQWVRLTVVLLITSHNDAEKQDIVVFVFFWQSNQCQISVSHISQMRCSKSYDEIILPRHCLLPWKSKTITALSEWVASFCSCYLWL